MVGFLFFFLFPDRYLLMLLAATVFAVDVAYIVLVHRQIRAEGQSPWAFTRPPVVDHRPALAPVG
jgi:hypothetical protein